MYYLEIFFLGLALSMDALSLSISISLLKKLTIYKVLTYSVVVGLYHFVMPVLGYLFRAQIENILVISSNILLICVFLFILLGVIIDKDNKITDKLLNPFLFGLSVSLDSFTVGITLNLNKLIISSTIFLIISFSMTFIGFHFGTKLRDKFQTKCRLITIVILVFFLLIKLIN